LKQLKIVTGIILIIAGASALAGKDATQLFALAEVLTGLILIR